MVIVGTLASCGPPMVQGPRHEFGQMAPPAGSNVGVVAQSMAGNYSSAEQAAADPSYFDVRLHMAPIWTDRVDGPWLYVEQAMADQQQQPYRQRIYHLVDAGAGRVEVIIFELPGDPLAYAGAWSAPDRLNSLDPTMMEPRMGCSVRLAPIGPGVFEGETRGQECQTNLRGASYVISQVKISPQVLWSWDRGMDDKGQQVWGPKLGPYVFKKEGVAPQVAAEPPTAPAAGAAEAAPPAPAEKQE